jgi:hypothetical protein
MADKVIEPGTHAEPPQPPPVRHRLSLYPGLWIGVLLLLIVPVLSLFRVFGQTYDSPQAASDALQLRVEYPTRTRYELPEVASVFVTNQSGEVQPTITVTISYEYINAFTNVSFEPAPDYVTDTQYVVELDNVPAGETRVIELELSGGKYWEQRGTVSASVEGGESVQVELSTFVFP